MSTPSTATATLPRYNPHLFPFSSHPHTQYTQANPPSYRPTNPFPSTSSRLGGYPSSTAYSPLSSTAGSNGVALSSSTPSNRTVAAPDSATSAPRTPANYADMPTSSQSQALADSQGSRKRRREVDWNAFYKNGLPKEIIVIDDDTPPPDRPAATSASKALANGHITNGSNGAANGSSNDSVGQHLAKRRKRDDETTRYDPVYNNTIVVGSHTNTPHQNATPSKSTVSSDRTNSAIHTTAATSLGSLSSNGQYDYEVQPGQKRKRTTRQQLANEARRREAGLAEAFSSYQPPPYPPKKAGDVHVRQIADVRIPSLGHRLHRAMLTMCPDRVCETAVCESTTTTVTTLWCPTMT
jgi:dual-specificity kinase